MNRRDKHLIFDFFGMIALLTGKVVGLKGSSVILDVHGVGYRVMVSTYALGKLAGQDEVTLHIHTHVREDQFSLFGFLEEDELNVFELLISVSGVGPKMALGILSIADTNTIRAAVVERDPTILTRISGVGKKTAEKIIVELQNKVTAAEVTGRASISADQDAIEGLMALGYSASQAREALKDIPSDITTPGERIRYALKSLGKK
jgi:Holliday junction DNA helicase RuvA